MALRVWLPLNGNINNQGLSGPCKGEGTLTYGSGKIGQALYMETASTANGIYAPKQEKQVYTVALWFKAPGYTGTRRDLCNEGRDYNTYGWRVGLAANENSLTMMAAGSGGNYTQSFTPDTWYHIAFCRDENKTAYYYINGVLVSTKTGTGDLNYSESNGFINIGRFCHNPTSNSKLYPYQGYINDFRYYDECLSPKQIKEISKGLVAHYKLTGVGTNPNLLVNAYTPTAWTYESCTKVNDINPYVIGFTTSAANQRIYLGVSNVWNSGQKYTYSFDAKASVADATIDASRSIADFGPTHYLTTDWKHYSGVINSTLTAEAGTLSIRGKTSGVTYYIKNVKLESGEKETIWIPNSTDALYTKLGYANDICTDVSGNGYNVAKNSTFTFSTDSPRYSGCNIFDTASSYLKLPVLTTSGFTNSFTVIYWAKITDMNGKMAWGFEDGNRLNIYPTGSVICCNTGDGSSNPYQNNGSSIAYSQWNNGWHQFAMVADGSTNKLYVDGQYQGTAKTYKGITGTQMYISGWDAGTSYRWVNGSISDFRIYATALTVDDILTLYKTSGIIDNKGNVYSYEFKEE